MEHKIKCLEELFPEYLLDLHNGVGLEATGICGAYDDTFRVKTGYSCELIKIFQRGTLTLVGARPSMGKTSFVINLALKMSLSHYNTVALFINELDRRDILSRMLSIQTNINLVKIQNGKISKEEFEHIEATAKKISSKDFCLDEDVYVPTPTGLFIDNSHYNSSSDIFEKCMEMKYESGTLDLVIVDDINLLVLKKGQEHLNSSMILRQLARDLDVPVIVTCGLERERIEASASKKPFITDLRPPAFEEHADSIILLHRDAYYDVTVENNILELIVSKNRNVIGKPTGTVRLSWDPKTLRMDDI